MDPIVIWPPATMFTDCAAYNGYYDCTYEYPYYHDWNATVCCPAY